MSAIFNRIYTLYKSGKIDDIALAIYVKKGLITEDEAKFIKRN